MWKAVAIAAFLVHIAGAQQSQKQFKQGEFDSYSEVIKDINSANFPKAVSDLDLWKRKYPDSDYKDDREALYVQAYAATSQPAKALDAAAPLVTGNLSAIFPGPDGQPAILRLLYNASWAISHIPD